MDYQNTGLLQPYIAVYFCTIFFQGQFDTTLLNILLLIHFSILRPIHVKWHCVYEHESTVRFLHFLR